MAEKKYLRIRVSDGPGTNVNVNIPLTLAKTAMKFIPKDTVMKFNAQDIDVNSLVDAVINGEYEDNLIEVEDGETKVRIYLD